MRNNRCLSKALDWAETQSFAPKFKRCPWFPRVSFTPKLLIPTRTLCRLSNSEIQGPYTCLFGFFRIISCIWISPETAVVCIWTHQVLSCTFYRHQKRTGSIHFLWSKQKFVSSLHPKCWNEFVWHAHLSTTTTAVLISAQILSRRDNWGLFSFSPAVWNYSFGQSIMLLPKVQPTTLREEKGLQLPP